MKKLIRSLSVILAIIMLTSLVGCQKADTAPTAVPVQGTKDNYFDSFQPVLRFAALSDSHIDDQGTELEEQRLIKVLQVANAYAAKDKNHSKLDAVLIGGDFTDYGTKSSMEKVRDLLTQNTDPGTKLMLSLGNHEYYVDKDNTEARFEAVFSSPINEHVVINGFHFIKFSPDTSGNAYSPATLSWLKEALAAAAAEDPTKPIFVMQHHVVKNTLFLSDYTVAVDNLYPIFEKYPQIVDFSGHSHYPMHNPRQIWQGDFTALGTGTLSYHSLIINNLKLPNWYTAVHDGTDGSWVLGHKRNKDGGEFYLVEVDAKGAVMVIAYDVNADKEIRRYYIQTPSDPSSFLYTDDRIEASQAPIFADNASVSVSNVTYNGFDLSFPQATCDDTVESYRVEVYREKVLVNTTILTSCFYLDPLPTTMVAKVRGVPMDTELTVKIYAVNAYNKPCTKPLTVTVKTGVFNLTPADSVPAPDVFRLELGKNLAIDAITGKDLDRVSTPYLYLDPQTGKPIAEFNGHSSLKFPGFNKHFSAMSQSVSFEVSLNLRGLSPSRSVLLGNMQSGGLGLEVDNNGLVSLGVYVNGTLKTVTAYPLEEWLDYHVVGTYDGQKLRIFVNGAPVNEADAPGKITWPTQETYLAIGADAGTDGKPESPMTGIIYHANVYSKALTPEEVYRAYLNMNA